MLYTIGNKTTLPHTHSIIFNHVYTTAYTSLQYNNRRYKIDYNLM